MQVDDGHDRLGAAREADADAGGEDLGEAVEANYSSDFWHLLLELEV